MCGVFLADSNRPHSRASPRPHPHRFNLIKEFSLLQICRTALYVFSPRVEFTVRVYTFLENCASVVCACAALQSTCCGVMLEMSVSECVSRVVTDRVCVRVTNIGHVISNTHNSQLANVKSRKDCRKLGWDVFVCVCQ